MMPHLLPSADTWRGRCQFPAVGWPQAGASVGSICLQPKQKQVSEALYKQASLGQNPVSHPPAQNSTEAGEAA